MKELMFSVPIYKYKVNNWKYKKKELLILFNSFDTKLVENVMTSPINIKTNIFEEEIKAFEIDCGLSSRLHEFWFQNYEKNMHHNVHNHGALGFSGICFIEYDKNHHAPTTFISPFINSISGEYAKYIINVEEGDIVFFPSNILHYVLPNLSTVPRLISSFNLEIIENKKKFCDYF
jgi:hypothetical protein